MEAAFSADLMGALQSGLDNIAIDAAISDLNNPTAASATATLSTYLGLFSNAVDAKAAIDFTQVRALLGLTTYKHAYGLTLANIGTAFELLPRERIRSSAPPGAERLRGPGGHRLPHGRRRQQVYRSDLAPGRTAPRPLQ